MPIFYIHIGSHKTGSKSIQNTFHGSRDVLLTRGINYLPISINHSVPLFSLFADKPHTYAMNLRQGVDTPQKAAEHNAGIRRRLEEELRRNDSPKVLISGEDLSVLSRAGVEAMKAALDPFAEAYRIVVYVRHPLEYALSATQERLKHGGTLEDARRKPQVPKYRRRIEKYLQVFGRENVDIRIFDPGRFIGNSLIADFCAAIGEPPELPASLQERRSNESMSLEAAVLLNELNKAKPAFENNRYNRERALEVSRWIARVKGGKFALPADVLADVERRVRDDLAWLRGILGSEVFAQPARAPAEPTPIWDAATLQSVALTINDLGLAEQRGSARNAFLQGRIAFLEGDFAAAERHFRAAIRLDPDSSEAHRHLSATLARLGRRGEAVGAIRRAVAASPAWRKTREWLQAAGARAGLGRRRHGDGPDDAAGRERPSAVSEAGE